ncbi:MAG TPA: N-acyl homoserine lactonase family protein [Bryobacteraceae bacterium]
MRKALLPLIFALAALPLAAQSKPQPPASMRMYVFNCGTIKAMSVTTYGFKEGEVQPRDFVVTAYLVVHPRGTLMWDTGLTRDAALKPESGIKPLKTQLAEIGYSPADITYLAMSHYHSDHTANASDFASATWIVQKAERDAMFADQPARIMAPATYNALKNSKTKILNGEDFDVFGDGSAIIKTAPGHTPGHQVLFLKFAKDGNILLAGDLYHFPEEQTLNRFPTFEFNVPQSAASRAAINEFLKKNNARMWISHDLATYNQAKKSPQYYE